MTHRGPLLVAGTLLLLACSNPFAPDKEPGQPGDRNPAPPATTPEQLMDNLRRAMRDRDIDLYETLLDQDFWFTETDTRGDLVFANGREEELEILGGSRDGSRPGIFDTFRTFEFEFFQIRRYVELGEDYPEAYPGDPDGHPDEDWEVFYGNVEMLLLDEHGDGYRVDQRMTYKMRLTDEGIWTLIRWVNDPLVGDAPAERPLTGLRSWSALKQAVY